MKSTNKVLSDNEKQKLLWETIFEEMAVFDWQDWIQPKLGIGSSEYTERLQHILIFCPFCFEPIKTSVKQCPNCGSKLDTSLMETLRDNSFELAAYAWNYRNKYEKEILQGKIHKGRVATQYYLVPPTDWLTYLASVALAAIIGGLSYDAFKKLISKTSQIFRKRFRKEIPRDALLNKFYNNLREYFIGKRNRDSHIFMAYIKELTKGQMMIAQDESNPDFENKLNELSEFIRNPHDVEEADLSVLTPLERNTSFKKNQRAQKLVEKRAEKLADRLKEQESKIAQLQDYLRQIHHLTENNEED